MAASSLEPKGNFVERIEPKMEKNKLNSLSHVQRYVEAAKQCHGRILDLGCGLGYGAAILSKSGRNVIGIDFSLAALSYARSVYRGPQYVVANINNLPFRNNIFDVVVAFEIIEHVPEPHRALDEISRVLREKGVLFASTPNIENLSNRFAHLIFKRPYKVENPYHILEFTYKDFLNLIREHGFRINKIQGQILTIPVVGKMANRSIYFASLLIKLGRIAPKYSAIVIVHALKVQSAENNKRH